MLEARWRNRLIQKGQGSGERHSEGCSPDWQVVDDWHMRQKVLDPLIVSDGGLASLVAVWREIARAGHDRAGRPQVRVREELEAVVRGNGPAGATIWLAPGLSRQASAAVERQAELAGFDLDIRKPSVLSTGGDGMAGNALLLSACAIAIDRGLGKVVWPVHLGAEAGDRAVDVHDRANMVSHLAAIDLPRQGGVGEIRVEAPLVELPDVELLDLALDLDAPVPRPVRGAAAFGRGQGACWWCERGGDAQCGVCGSCGRWGVAWGAVDPAGVLAAG